MSCLAAIKLLEPLLYVHSIVRCSGELGNFSIKVCKPSIKRLEVFAYNQHEQMAKSRIPILGSRPSISRRDYLVKRAIRSFTSYL